MPVYPGALITPGYNTNPIRKLGTAPMVQFIESQIIRTQAKDS